ncbi:MAG: DNA ligase [Candidatus Mycalebacterium zealandia]|nr:MAG: DNA ligase [Candidatus Mycalebacterium zealandia]
MYFSKRTLFLAAVFILTAFAAVPPVFAVPHDFALANPYGKNVDVSKYLVSEKLDGVRAYWDGKRLISRGGNVFAAPFWFTQGFPSEPMDGELWGGRNSFEKTSSIVMRDKPHPRWKKIKYMVFDLPAHKGEFRKRDKALKKLVRSADSPYLEKVRQFNVRDKRELRRKLKEITKNGGEGLILRRKDSPHRSGRSDDLLKFKLFYDAEAVVIAHNPGRGRFKGMLGSVTVKTPEGVTFKIGTGFSNKERVNPPPIGSTITYKYTGFTKNGIPKFASFQRVREEK